MDAAKVAVLLNVQPNAPFDFQRDFVWFARELLGAILCESETVGCVRRRNLDKGIAFCPYAAELFEQGRSTERLT